MSKGRKPDGNAQDVRTFNGSKRSRLNTIEVSDPPSNPSKRTTRSTSQVQTDSEQVDIQRAVPHLEEVEQHAVLPLLPPRAPEQITQTAMGVASTNLDAQEHDRFKRDVSADDGIAELASRRGLLVTFKVRTGHTVGSFNPPLLVEAPEFSTVTYLKRRIFKAKLMAGDFCPPERFALKQRPVASADVQAPASWESLSEESNEGVPLLLFNLGFEAGKAYNLTMTSKASTTDKAQQENLLRSAAAAGKGPVGIPLSSNPEVGEYQQLLAGPPGAAIAGAPPRQYQRQAVAGGLPRGQTTHGAPSPERPKLGSTYVPRAVPLSPFAPRGQKAGRWQEEEVICLVDGVSAYGYSWSTIRAVFKDDINPLRTPVDLKDKWRNLVKQATMQVSGRPGAVLADHFASRVLDIIALDKAYAETAP